MKNPKLYISYYPKDLDFERSVLQIATDLQEAGVEVVFDKWDLSPLADKKTFSENVLADPELDKILILVDKNYKKQTEGENETDNPPVITGEIYKRFGKEKIAPVILEKDEDGKPYLPEFFDPNFLFDLSEDDRYSDEFHKLLRWAYGLPLYAKPAVIKRPDFSEKKDALNLGTNRAFRNALEAIRQRKATTEGRIDEYLNLFTGNLERFRITETDGEMDEAVFQNIEAFKTFRNEYVRLIIALAGYNPRINYKKKIHRFIESLIFYTTPGKHVPVHVTWDLDNFSFMVHEIFLYTLAVLLKYERFPQAAYLLTEKYYIPGKSRYGYDEMIAFDKIHCHIESLESYNERMNLGEEAFRASLIKERSIGSGIDFRYLMQADFVAFLKAENFYQPYYSQWYPETLAFLRDPHGPMEIFARARSRRFFNKIKGLLGIELLPDLSPLITSYETGTRQLPRGLGPQSPGLLIGFKLLASA